MSTRAHFPAPLLLCLFLASSCYETSQAQGQKQGQEGSLQPGAQRIEILRAEPDRERFEYLGDIQAEATAPDIGEATRDARNDMKNRASAMGATFVVLDTSASGHAFLGEIKIVMTGRAFRPKR